MDATHTRRRRFLAAFLLVALGVVWSLIALQIGGWAARVATNVFRSRLIQTWTGTVAPSPDFQPLRITLSAEVVPAGALDLRDGDLLLVRAMGTTRNGPTAPLRFRATTPPAPSDVAAWLATYGVPHGPAVDDAIAEALAVVRAANAATTREALHDLELDRPVQPQPDAIIELKPTTPEWIEIAVTAFALLAGFIPLAIVVIRHVRTT